MKHPMELPEDLGTTTTVTEPFEPRRSVTRLADAARTYCSSELLGGDGEIPVDVIEMASGSMLNTRPHDPLLPM
jgi:hypothetical protein